MYTRDEFEEVRIDAARRMAEDLELQKEATDVFVKADRYMWIHQTNWLGEPVLQLPQDLFAFQEIIHQTRPKFVIELGVAWGGGLLFYATLMEALGDGQVIGVDTYLPDDLKQRLSGHGKISERIHLIDGSSIDPATVAAVKSLTGGSREVMIHLDSNHTHDHVLEELRLYSPLVGKDHYLICGDTMIEFIPPQLHRARAWGPGNNPKTARDAFFKENDRFEEDRRLNDKLLITNNPAGYLRAIKD